MATVQQLETALRNADKAGDAAAATKLAAEIRRMRQTPAETIPLGEDGQDVPQTPQPQRDLSIGEQIVGAGESLVTTGLNIPSSVTPMSAIRLLKSPVNCHLTFPMVKWQWPVHVAGKCNGLWQKR